MSSFQRFPFLLLAVAAFMVDGRVSAQVQRVNVMPGYPNAPRTSPAQRRPIRPADTLILWGGEFGRTPVAEFPALNGRDHNHYGFSVWLAGGGIKGGTIHGATDELGFRAVENLTPVHDLHATMLHLLGLDHERLTYRYAGRDFRLTDVSGHVIKEILA